MSWNEIKYTLNSTLGTSRHIPLDEIIYGQRSVQASDDFTDIFWNFTPTPISVYASSDILKTKTIQVLTSGSVNLYILVPYAYNKGIFYETYHNDEAIVTDAPLTPNLYGLKVEIDDTTYYAAKRTIPVKCGDSIYVTMRAYNPSTWPNSSAYNVRCYLLGNMTDNAARIID